MTFFRRVLSKIRPAKTVSFDPDTTLHSFEARDIAGETRSLKEFEGQVLLVVNVASACGLTPQYEGLQRVHAANDDVQVLGFPCNQFKGQEPGTEAEIRTFCSSTYGVTFPLFSKIEVNGAGRDPLYAWLTQQATDPAGPGDITWNFEKFVVGRDGRVVARFAPDVEPEDASVAAALERARS